MNFIKADYVKRTAAWSMSDLKNHDYYEFYFLLGGTRRLFLDHNIYEVSAPALCIVPPFCMHKTEGDAYERINLYVSRENLTESERFFLENQDNAPVFRLDPAKEPLLKELLFFAANLPDNALNLNILLNAFHVIFYLMRKQGVLTPAGVRCNKETALSRNNNTVLRVAEYINSHYTENFTVKDLCALFYISKNTLCSHFFKVMRCSLMQYRTHVRLNKAKEFLLSSDKSMEEIAELCGFSSANYFSLIFKQKIGVSPAGYRKTR